MKPHRGSAILPVIIVIVVLAAVTAASMRIAMNSKNDAARDARKLTQTSCVEAARQHLLGRLRVFGIDPTKLQFQQAVSLSNGRSLTLRTGHIDGPMVTSVRAVPPSVVGASGKARDLSNTIVPGAKTGGIPYRVVVACSDPLAGEMELEFTFSYGL